MVVRFSRGKIVITQNEEEPKIYACNEAHHSKKVRLTREQRNRLYYLKHREDYYGFQYECECGNFITKSHLNRHRESIKHHKNLDAKN
jgi:hypothetical protein